MKTGLAALVIAGTGVLAPSGAALAQQMTAEDIISTLQSMEDSLLTRPLATPGSYGVISGFGLSGGQAMAALSASDHTGRTTRDWDGSGGVGLGLGNPDDGVGLQMTASITSVHPDDFGDSGNFGFMLHKRAPGLTADGFSSISVGVHSVSGWGDADEIDEEYYVSGSTVLHAGSLPVMLTAGYGSGADASEFILDPDGAAFGSIGVGLTEHFAVSAGWDGDEMVAGLDIRPAPAIPLQFTVGASDLTEELGSSRLLISASWLATF